MRTFPVLRAPVVAAPMAGGPSTAELVAAVGAAGGVGFLAAGYCPVDRLADQIHEVRARGTDVFGVNLFVPDASTPDPDAVEAYRTALGPTAAELGIAGLPRARDDDDAWSEKVDLLVADPVPMVSFTFGLPDPDTVRRLRSVDTLLLATVTSAEDARAAESAGMDVLVVQGPDAGGHQGTFRTEDPAPDVPLQVLLSDVASVTSLPLVAAGGLVEAEDVGRVLEAGAIAAQVGTAFLLSPEAGTNPTHRAALESRAFDRTTVTRAFSGRPARGLHNRFIELFDARAPTAYPQVNQVTGPIRKAAAASGYAQLTHLWAGTGWQHARAEPAADVVTRLAGGHG